MEEKVSFQSDGLKIAGLVDIPEDYKAGERRPAFIMLHGFGGNKDGQGQKVVGKQMAKWGYVSLRVDFRGCGDSEGERGRIICLDQVADTRNAISRARAEACAVIKLARLAQAISNTSATNTPSTSNDRR